MHEVPLREYPVMQVRQVLMVVMQVAQGEAQAVQLTGCVLTVEELLELVIVVAGSRATYPEEQDRHVLPSRQLSQPSGQLLLPQTSLER